MYSDAFGYNPQIPDNVRLIFMWLCQDVAALRNKWDFYVVLYGREENTGLLSDLAPASFQMIEESLRNDMTMAIGRLGDAAGSGRRENLSLAALVQGLSEPGAAADLLEDFKEVYRPVKHFRNKRVGHNDLNTKIKPQENLLPGIGRKHIDRIIELAEEILNLVYQRFVDGELCFEPLKIGGADDLIFWLEMAKEYETMKRNAWLGKTA